MQSTVVASVMFHNNQGSISQSDTVNHGTRRSPISMHTCMCQFSISSCIDFARADSCWMESARKLMSPKRSQFN